MNRILFLLTFFITSQALAGPLQDILVKTRQTHAQGNVPIVIFDLDDTLFDSRTRQLTIIRELALTHPEQAEKLSKIRLSEIGYYFNDALKNAGITDESFLKTAQEFWAPRFFSDSYCLKDRPIKGAQAFVQALSQAGAQIVYLTGRDRPRMGKGTASSLELRGFATDASAHLIMRPSKKMDEVRFKKRVLEWLGKKGQVIAAFENEPKNINMMKETFLDGMMVFLDTIHSKSPDAVRGNIFHIRDFH